MLVGPPGNCSACPWIKTALVVVGFTTNCAIGAYRNWCEFKSSLGRAVQHYVIKFVSD